MGGSLVLEGDIIKIAQIDMSDPVKISINKYPRILVIRAAFEVLKAGKKITRKTLEKELIRNVKVIG